MKIYLTAVQGFTVEKNRAGALISEQIVIDLLQNNEYSCTTDEAATAICIISQKGG